MNPDTTQIETMAKTAPDNASRNVRQDIIDSAVENFDNCGYHGTTMRDIGRGAHITVGSIYNHFDSKQAILQSIMVDIHSDALQLTTHEIKAAGEQPVSRLDAMVRSWTIFHTGRRAEAHVASTELRALDAPGRRKVVTLRDEQEKLFRTVIRDGVEAGDFGTELVDDVARTIIAVGVSLTTWFNPAGDLDANDLAARHVRMARTLVEYSPQ